MGWRIEGMDDNPGVFLINVSAYLNATWYLLLSVLYEVCATIFTSPNLKISNDRTGLTRSAVFLFFFIVIHAVGNLHVFKGPDDFNGYGYFYVRLYWTGFGFDANIVEEYVLLAALLHVAVALKRTWDISIKYTLDSGKLNLAISGVMLLTFMMIHLFQFRFGATHGFKICPPPYLVNVQGVLSLDLFWVPTNDCKSIGSEIAIVRDIYRLEFELFQNFGWVLFYLSSVTIFSTHMCLGWRKAIAAEAFGVPPRYHTKATHIGYAMTAFIALIYLSFPIYCHLATMSQGFLSSEPA